MIRARARALVLVLVLCFAATAVQADVPARLEQSFRDWRKDVGVDAAVMTIWRAGVHHQDVALSMSADTPVELASLGKAVTAACAATLMDAGVWQGDTTSVAVLGYGPDDITVSQLLTHSAGLLPDETQNQMPLWLDIPLDRGNAASRKALSRKAQGGIAGQYSYSNENYAILGAMIAAQTGQSYEEYCREAVIAPAGLTSARVSPRTGAFASWGGWRMTVQDYARFMYWAYGPDGQIAARLEDWPSADIGGGARYGMGMVHRPFRGSHNFWHFGLLCFPGRLNAGSYAVSWMEEWQVVVAFDRCLNWDQMFALDGALARAVFP